MEQDKNQQPREFKLTSWALNNKSTVYLMTVIITLFGLISYQGMPKELFPEIVFPTILVQTVYPGNPPIDIENLITRPIEKECEDAKGLKKLTSTSLQDASMVMVEFNTNVPLSEALQEVKDAVDRAKGELPTDLMTDPFVTDVDFSEFPIININLSGDFSLEELKQYAEYLEDIVEPISEISKVEIQGIEDREIVVDVDLMKMEALGLSFLDIENAIAFENISMAGGEIKLGKTRRSIRIVGEFDSVKEMESIIVKRNKGRTIYLRDVANVLDTYAEAKTMARLDGKPVVSVQVIKKGGENLLNATDQIFKILDHAKESGALPATLNISLTNDQSDMIRKQLSNLENSLILGVIFVVFVLFYFLGTRNALFVGIAIPLSMLMSFMVLNVIGYQINMIVLFGLILALGMLVDNAIVVVENIYRFVDKGYKPQEAAKLAVGEIAIPIIASTATTLAAFLPLAFWGGITGEFMKNLPITLIIVLTSSLVVALVIIPVISATFIKHGDNRHDNTPNKNKAFKTTGIIAAIAIGFYILKIFTIANILMMVAIIVFLNAVFFYKVERWFRDVFLVRLENIYGRALKYTLKGWRPIWFFGGSILLMILTFAFYIYRQPAVKFFPENEPRYINIVAELPIGSDITATDSVMQTMGKDVDILLEPYTNILESVLITIGKGDPENWSMFGDQVHKALTTITFVEYKDRGGVSTKDIMEMLTYKLKNKYPGVELAFSKNNMGPPAGKAINIEISGAEFNNLLALTDTMSAYIKTSGIEGIEGLKIDLDLGKPELLIEIDRDKARRLGLSTMQIAGAIRTSLYGKEISRFKEGEDDFPIQLRYMDKYRYDLPTLLSQKVGFMEEGEMIQIPISSVATFKYSTTYGSVKRKNGNRVVTLYSNILPGFNATNINQQIKLILTDFNLPEGYEYAFTGEQEEQAESMAFLVNAMLIALALIILILVTQFNSLVRPLIIMTSVILSTIGVFGGLATFKMDFVVVMTGIGLVSLAGIVVNNAIVLIDYIGLLKKQKIIELGLDVDSFLPVEIATECVVEAGRTRLRPVLLTAITTVLGLIPMAIGLNIDFAGALADFNPDIYFGGDNVIMWGPISWTIIFGLTFSTFLTLIIVPVMYRITVKMQRMYIIWSGQDSRLK